MRLVERLKASPIAVPLAVFAIGVVASAFAAIQISRIAAAKDMDRFAGTVAQTRDSIKARLETYIAMMRAGAGLVAASDGNVSREQFQRYVAQLRLSEQYPGVQGIGYSVRLPENAPQAAALFKTLGVSDLQLYPPRYSGSDRDERHAIVHLEPLDRRNQAALGYDMYSEEVRRAAMIRARDTGEPIASGRVQLVQEIEERKQAGFLIYMPVYRGGAIPSRVTERREKLLGFVYAPFRADDLMRGIFGERPRIRTEIYEGDAVDSNLLHRSGPLEHTPRFTTTEAMSIADRSWTVTYATLPQFESTSNREFAAFALLGGMLTSLLLAVLTGAQARQKRRALDAVSAWRTTARELEVLHSTAARLSGELEADRLVQAVTDAGREISGAEIGAFFYNQIDECGESYMLYSLSGAPREAFAGMGMPRNTAVFGPTFKGEGVVRVPDITQDSRFGKSDPHRGFPKGHWPVRSYLAAPVISRSGMVLGGLFFGHSQVGVFTEQAERSVVALAGHAAIALDNARLFKSSQDEISARKKIEEHQKLLLDELNHRVKNTLATVQSIAAQTLRTSPDVDAFKRAFEARLIALSEAHNLLSRSNWRGVDLGELTRRELAPHGAEHTDRISIQGDTVLLSPASAVAIGMALHELATNAARHGSLSAPNGRVEVNWAVSNGGGGRLLRLVWQESGGPVVREPARRGFGSRLLERGLKHDLRGETKLFFEERGLKCVIEVMLTTELAAA